MSGPGALVATAVTLLVVAGILAVAADSLYRPKPRIYARMGWVVLTLSALAFIGSAWWEALS